jgi:hypothetical protein
MRNWLLCWVLFTAASFALTPIPGVNEPHYLCKSRAFHDPTWCADDFFLHSSFPHYVFYALTGLPAAVLPFGVVAAIGRIVSSGVIAFGWCRLTTAAQVPLRGTLFSASVFTGLVLCGSLSGEWLIGGFESKTSSWGFGLIAVAAWLQQKPATVSFRGGVVGGFWLGLAIMLHPVVGGWLLLSILLTDTVLLIARRWNWHTEPPLGSDNTWHTANESRVLQSLVCFTLTAVIVALPGLIPALQLILNSNTTPERQAIANFIQVFGRLKHHLDPVSFRGAGWIWLAILSGLLFVSLRWIRQHLKPEDRMPVQLPALMLAACWIATCGLAIGWHRVPADRMTGWAWRAALLKFYPFRMLDILLPIVLSLAITQIVFCGRSFRPLLKFRFGPGKTISGLSLLASVAAIACAATMHQSPPSGYTRTRFTDWQRSCAWVREQSPVEAVFITPRESFGFKWFAERAEYVCYKDCPQDAEGLIEWNRRNRLMRSWRRQAARDGRYTQSELQQLARMTAATWLITRPYPRIAAEPAFSTPSWNVYQLPVADDAHNAL